MGGKKCHGWTACSFSIPFPLPSPNAPSGAKSYEWSAATTAPCTAVSTERRSPESTPAGRAGGTSEGGKDQSFGKSAKASGGAVDPAGTGVVGPPQEATQASSGSGDPHRGAPQPPLVPHWPTPAKR